MCVNGVCLKMGFALHVRLVGTMTSEVRQEAWP